MVAHGTSRSIPAIRVGERSVRYSVAALEQWIAEQIAASRRLGILSTSCRQFGTRHFLSSSLKEVFQWLVCMVLTPRKWSPRAHSIRSQRVTYSAVISESELKKTKDGTGEYLELKFRIVDGAVLPIVFFGTD